jgi:hypothetical protein
MLNRYFDKANLVFWLLILLLVIIFYSFAKDIIFDNSKFLVEKERNQEIDLNIKKDSTSSSGKEKPEEEILRNYKKIQWQWDDPYSSKKGKIAIEILEDDYQRAVKHRKSLLGDYHNIYSKIIKNDLPILKKMAEEFEKQCRANQFDHTQSLKFVVGAIQSIPYTLVLNTSFFKKCPCTLNNNEYIDDCSARNDRKGCCNDINNYGLFTPVEFAVRKTGDCDTRTVFAYTILSQMGYDVTIFNNNSHSILGVSSPSLMGTWNSIRGNNGKIYLAIELTSVIEPGIRLEKLSSFKSVIK